MSELEDRMSAGRITPGANEDRIHAGADKDSSFTVDDRIRPAVDVVSLYPRDMNIYGDTGNVLVVAKRLWLYGYQPVVHYVNQGDAWPEHVDIILGGGGQDSGQKKIQDDLMVRAPQLRQMADEGVPMLVICGLYQLFGNFFRTIDGDEIPGIGIFDAETLGKTARLIGNLVANSDYGTLVGYENHSGQTFLHGQTKALGHVTSGEGNNAEDETEGAQKNNVIGTYMHGSVLPKNPKLADFLVMKAVEHRYGSFTNLADQAMQEELNRLDECALKASQVAQHRPR